MKKFMAMLLTLAMALSLVACGQKADDTKKDDAAADTDDSLVVLENVVDWGETEPYRVLVQKGDPKGLLPGINKAIAELTANDGALIKEIENKVASQETYTPDSVSSDLAAADKDAAASDKPVLVMGTSPDYPPYEFFADAAMTEYAGIDVEVAKYIAESMGMDPADRVHELRQPGDLPEQRRLRRGAGRLRVHRGACSRPATSPIPTTPICLPSFW